MQKIYSNGALKDRISSNEEVRNNCARYYTKSNWLSGYAMACGYIERIDFQKQIESFPAEIVLTLEKDSACFHVKAYNFSTHERLQWDSFETVTQARKAFVKSRNAIVKGDMK